MNLIIAFFMHEILLVHALERDKIYTALSTNNNNNHTP